MASSKIQMHNLDPSLLEQLSRYIPNFDNPLEWVGCRKIVVSSEDDSELVEQIVTFNDQILKAERTTFIGEDETMQTYITFYEDDGTTIKAKYKVHTTKDESETFYEDVTQENTNN